jgi:hypothetical protein
MINQTSAVSLTRTATSKHSLSAFKSDKNRLKNIIESSTVEINDSINFNRRVFTGRGQAATEWYPNFPKAKVIKIETMDPKYEKTVSKYAHHVCADMNCCKNAFKTRKAEFMR